MSPIIPYIQQSTKSLARTINKNSPSILTGLGIAGLVSTVILAVMATPRALDKIKEEEERRWDEEDIPDGDTIIPMTPFEVAKVVWPCYIPTTIMGATTIACILGSNSINTQRNAALVGLYSLTENALREYKAKVIETIGEKKEAKIHDDIAEDKLKQNPVQDNTIILTGKGEMLCYEVLSGRYFKSDVETLRRIENDFNNHLLSEMFIPLNELFDDMGLKPITLGEKIGWNIETNMLKFRFSAKLTDDNQPCIVISYVNEPGFPGW